MKDNQIHTYAVYVHTDEKDKTKKETRFVPLTHIWKLDNKRWKAYKKNHLTIERFDKEELTRNMWQGKFGIPSGVENSYYATDVSGNPLTIKNPNVTYVGKTIGNDKAERIQKFAYRRFEKGLYVDRKKDDLRKSAKHNKK